MSRCQLRKAMRLNCTSGDEAISCCTDGAAQHESPIGIPLGPESDQEDLMQEMEPQRRLGRQLSPGSIWSRRAREIGHANCRRHVAQHRQLGAIDESFLWRHISTNAHALRTICRADRRLRRRMVATIRAESNLLRRGRAQIDVVRTMAAPPSQRLEEQHGRRQTGQKCVHTRP